MSDPRGGLSQIDNRDSEESALFETMGRVDHDLKDVIAALALLGVRRCSQCEHFFRKTDPGALFENGQTVCYKCIPDWWALWSARTDPAEREGKGRQLAAWLRKYHQAEVVKETPGRPINNTNIEFQIVAKCAECAGSGKLMEEERCRFCNGFGSIRIVVPK